MRFEFKTKHYAGIGFGVVVALLDLMFLFDFSKFKPAEWYFNPIFVLGFVVAGLPFLFDFLNETKRQKELELKFLEFVRSLVESVRSGVSLPQAIGRVSRSDHGSLTPYIRKLAAQLEWGYPLNDALTIFANDTKNPVINRSLAIVMQAEKSGGDVASVLDSVTKSVLEIKKLKEERKTNAYNQMIQGYIIFFVFIAIMLVLQIYLVPKLSDIGGEIMGGLEGGVGFGGAAMAAGGGGADMGAIFITVILVQGLFTGLMIGKFSEGSVKGGVKHSVLLMIGGYLVMSTFTGIFLGLFLLVREEVVLRCIKKRE